MIYIQSFLIWLYTKSPLICYNKSKANGLEHCESSILYREGFILCCPSIFSTLIYMGVEFFVYGSTKRIKIIPHFPYLTALP